MSNFCFNFRSVFIVLILFLLNIRKETSLPGFRIKGLVFFQYIQNVPMMTQNRGH